MSANPIATADEEKSFSKAREDIVSILARSPVGWKVMANWYIAGATGELKPDQLLAQSDRSSENHLRTMCREVANHCTSLVKLDANRELDPLGVPMNRSILTKPLIKTFSNRLLDGLSAFTPSDTRLVAAAEHVLAHSEPDSPPNAAERKGLTAALSVLQPLTDKAEVGALLGDKARQARQFGPTAIRTMEIDLSNVGGWNLGLSPGAAAATRPIARDDDDADDLPAIEQSATHAVSKHGDGAKPFLVGALHKARGRASGSLAQHQVFKNQNAELLHGLVAHGIQTRKNLVEALILQGAGKTMAPSQATQFLRGDITDKRSDELSQTALRVAKIAALAPEIAYPGHVPPEKIVAPAPKLPSAQGSDVSGKPFLVRVAHAVRGRVSGSLAAFPLFQENNAELLDALAVHGISTRRQLADALIEQGAGKTAAPVQATHFLGGNLTDKRSGGLSEVALRIARIAEIAPEIAYAGALSAVKIDNAAGERKSPARHALSRIGTLQNLFPDVLTGLHDKGIEFRQDLEAKLNEAGIDKKVKASLMKEIVSGNLLTKTGQATPALNFVIELSGVDRPSALRHVAPQASERPKAGPIWHPPVADPIAISTPALQPTAEIRHRHSLASRDFAGAELTHPKIFHGLVAAGLETQQQVFDALKKAEHTEAVAYFYVKSLAAGKLTFASGKPNKAMRALSSLAGVELPTREEAVAADRREDKKRQPLSEIEALKKPDLEPYVHGLAEAGINTATDLAKALRTQIREPTAYAYVSQFTQGIVTTEKYGQPNAAIRMIATLAKVRLDSEEGHKLSESTLPQSVPELFSGFMRHGVRTEEQLRQRVTGSNGHTRNVSDEEFGALLTGKIIDPQSHMPTEIALRAAQVAGVHPWTAYKRFLKQELERVVEGQSSSPQI